MWTCVEIARISRPYISRTQVLNCIYTFFVFVANQLNCCIVVKSVCTENSGVLYVVEAMTKPTTLPLMCVRKGKIPKRKFHWHWYASSNISCCCCEWNTFTSTYTLEMLILLARSLHSVIRGFSSINVLKCRTHKYYMRNTFMYAMRVCVCARCVSTTSNVYRHVELRIVGEKWNHIKIFDEGCWI